MSNEMLTVIRKTLEQGESQIAAAIPRTLAKYLTPERLIRLAVTAATKNPRLLECVPATIGTSVCEAASLGLEPTGLLGHGALVPRYNKNVGKMVCMFQIGYKGLLALAWRSGEVESVDAEAVYKGDHFKWSKGLNPVLEHIPSDTAVRTAENLTHAWACIRFKGGGYVFKVLGKGEIEARRASGDGGKSGPWVTHYGAMATKSALIAVCKLVELSPEAQRGVAKTEAIDEDRDPEDDDAGLSMLTAGAMATTGTRDGQQALPPPAAAPAPAQPPPRPPRAAQPPPLQQEPDPAGEELPMDGEPQSSNPPEEGEYQPPEPEQAPPLPPRTAQAAAAVADRRRRTQQTR